MNEKLIENNIFIELNFNKNWVEAGIINETNLEAITKEYLKGEDTHTEHYKWCAFRDFMRSNSVIPKQIFHILYDIGKNDPDYAMGRSIIFDVIGRLDCPEEIIDMLIESEDKILAKRALKSKCDRNI
jgi:hypothetical protein